MASADGLLHHLKTSTVWVDLTTTSKTAALNVCSCALLSATTTACACLSCDLDQGLSVTRVSMGSGSGSRAQLLERVVAGWGRLLVTFIANCPIARSGHTFESPLPPHSYLSW